MQCTSRLAHYDQTHYCIIFYLNPFMPSGLSFLRSLDRSNSYIRGVLWHLILVYIFCQCPFYGMPGIWDARHKWVKSAKQNCCRHFKTVFFISQRKQGLTFHLNHEISFDLKKKRNFCLALSRVDSEGSDQTIKASITWVLAV